MKSYIYIYLYLDIFTNYYVYIQDSKLIYLDFSMQIYSKNYVNQWKIRKYSNKHFKKKEVGPKSIMENK